MARAVEQVGERAQVENGVVGKVRGVMLRRVRPIMIAAGGVAVVLVVCASLLDMGEVVIIHTTDDASRSHETQVWIVELDGEKYLRASRPGARWLVRLRHRSAAVMERDGEEGEVRAYPEDEASVRDRVNRAMAEKYGLADRLWGTLSDYSYSVPIRLEAADEAHASRPVNGEGGTP